MNESVRRREIEPRAASSLATHSAHRSTIYSGNVAQPSRQPSSVESQGRPQPVNQQNTRLASSTSIFPHQAVSQTRINLSQPVTHVATPPSADHSKAQFGSIHRGQDIVPERSNSHATTRRAYGVHESTVHVPDTVFQHPTAVSLPIPSRNRQTSDGGLESPLTQAVGGRSPLSFGGHSTDSASGLRSVHRSFFSPSAPSPAVMLKGFTMSEPQNLLGPSVGVNSAQAYVEQRNLGRRSNIDSQDNKKSMDRAITSLGGRETLSEDRFSLGPHHKSMAEGNLGYNVGGSSASQAHSSQSGRTQSLMKSDNQRVLPSSRPNPYLQAHALQQQMVSPASICRQPIRAATAVGDVTNQRVEPIGQPQHVIHSADQIESFDRGGGHSGTQWDAKMMTSRFSGSLPVGTSAPHGWSEKQPVSLKIRERPATAHDDLSHSRKHAISLDSDLPQRSRRNVASYGVPMMSDHSLSTLASSKASDGYHYSSASSGLDAAESLKGNVDAGVQRLTKWNNNTNSSTLSSLRVNPITPIDVPTKELPVAEIEGPIKRVKGEDTQRETIEARKMRRAALVRSRNRGSSKSSQAETTVEEGEDEKLPLLPVMESIPGTGNSSMMKLSNASDKSTDPFLFKDSSASTDVSQPKEFLSRAGSSKDTTRKESRISKDRANDEDNARINSGAFCPPDNANIRKESRLEMEKVITESAARELASATREHSALDKKSNADLGFSEKVRSLRKVIGSLPGGLVVSAAPSGQPGRPNNV